MTAHGRSNSKIRRHKKKTVPLKKKSRRQEVNSEEPCNSCGRVYDDQEFDTFPKFPWGQCLQCKMWYHDICDETCYASGVCKQYA